jgi:hypothetical protein
MDLTALVRAARTIPNPELWILGIVLAAVCVAQALLS